MMLQVSKLVVLHCVEGWYVGMTPQSRFSRNYFTEAEAIDALKATREHFGKEQTRGVSTIYLI